MHLLAPCICCLATCQYGALQETRDSRRHLLVGDNILYRPIILGNGWGGLVYLL